jgi:hypothetical protein
MLKNDKWIAQMARDRQGKYQNQTEEVTLARV